MTANIGIPAKHLQAVSNELQKLLADEYLVYTKTRNYHWNVEGSNFMEMHKFYQSLYEELDEMIDEIAERIRKLGHYSEGRIKDFLKLTRLDEPDYTSDQKSQLENLLSDHEQIIQSLRKAIPVFADTHKDYGSSDFITGLMEQHEKMAWFIRSYLK